MTAITDQNLRDKPMKDKKAEIKKNDRNDKTNHLGKEEQQKHNTGSTDIQPRKRDKEKTDPKNG